jgi:hypothetical protein
MIVDPNTPVYNTIIFYIMIVCIILIIKPRFMYCQETKRFKPFGCGEDGTIMSFPLVSIGSGIVLYLFFLLVFILNQFLENHGI